MKLTKWIEVSLLALVMAIGAAGCQSSKPGVMHFSDPNMKRNTGIADIPSTPAVA